MLSDRIGYAFLPFTLTIGTLPSNNLVPIPHLWNSGDTIRNSPWIGMDSADKRAGVLSSPTRAHPTQKTLVPSGFRSLSFPGSY